MRSPPCPDVRHSDAKVSKKHQNRPNIYRIPLKVSKKFDIECKILYIKYTCGAGVPSRHIPVPSPVYTRGTVVSKEQGSQISQSFIQNITLFCGKVNLYDPYRIRHICRRHRHCRG